MSVHTQEPGEALWLAMTTAGSAVQARELARFAVQARLAACAQISVIESVYRWQGQVQQEAEWRVLFKTTARAWPALQAALDAVNQADARPLLAHIRTPSLLVFGQKDAITPPRMGEYLNRHLTDSELVLMEKAAHAPFLSHADEFAERYRGFVEKAV